MGCLRYVNIKQGSDTDERLSRGNTLPLIQRPFGFSSVCPQTNGERSPWFYSPRDKCFEGYRFTHQPSPWINERGAVVVSVSTDVPASESFFNWSPFDEGKTRLSPHLASYYLKRHKAVFSVTPTEFGGLFKASFENEGARFISVIPALEGEYNFKLSKEKNRLFVSADYDYWWEKTNEKVVVYYCLAFENGAVDWNGVISNANGAVHLPLTVKELTFTVAQSYICFEQAERNLTFGDFDETAAENEALWESFLSRIEIDADEETKKTFYSCLYRGLLYPHRAYEFNEKGEKVHYAPALGREAKGVRYTDNGFWDTYRTVYPFFSIVYPEVLEEMVEGFLADYLDGGWLPRWSALSCKNCMPSTAIDAVIADLAVKGIIKGPLLRKCFEAMEKHANFPSENEAYGRAGIEEYLKFGYVPFDRREHNSVNLSVDFSYHDWCISRVAELLGEEEKARKYRERSSNWQKLFDKESGCLRARYSDGRFYEDFHPLGWGFEYTEASPIVTTLSAQHDLEGLAALYGGRERFIRRLDEIFSMKNEFRIARWNRAIHEMAEYALEDLGAVAISNEPSFHIPFIYSYFGEKEKASALVRKIAKEEFSYRDDGFPGDEDNGAMALWYCFAVLGLYPICPGENRFVETEKLCESFKVKGKEFKI